MNMSQTCHDLALLNVIQHMKDEYKDVTLSNEQLYTLYQKYYNPEDFKEIVGYGTAENLSF